MALKISEDINSTAGLAKLNDFLAERSYIEGYTASQSDVVLADAIKTVSAAHPHVLRWWKHLKSYSSEKAKLPGVKKSLADLGVTGGAPAAAAPAKGKPAPADDDDDDVDLFGEEDDEEAEKLKAERVKAYNEKKSKKPALVAKSNVILDVKPWDDETDMAELEKAVRSVEMPGLMWGISKLVPLAYGIKKLQIVCVVEDDKVSIDELSEKLCEFEDFVQSVDIAAFQKI